MEPGFSVLGNQLIRMRLGHRHQHQRYRVSGHYASTGVQRQRAASPMKKVSPSAVQSGAVGHEVNISRILVIPRGPKGFGFILRGAKGLNANLRFEPTPEIPALQYFEGVDMHGMAMKAGLKPGDFLLEINGEDVRDATHDEVVALVQAAGDTITLKVVTVDLTRPGAAPYYATLRRGSQTNGGGGSAEGGKRAPPPPERHPTTSLSRARGSNVVLHRGLAQLDETLAHYDDDGRSIGDSESTLAGAEPVYRSLSHGGRYASSQYSGESPIYASSVYHRQSSSGGEKVASVRGRVHSRRTSMTEIEQFMARQAVLTHSQNQQQMTPEASRPQGPRVYSSVAEMKRSKGQKGQNGSPPGPAPLPPPQMPMMMGQDETPVKSFNSTPELYHPPNSRRSSSRSNSTAQEQQHNGMHGRYPYQQDMMVDDGSGTPIYASNRLRPKTPPPPPPQGQSHGPALRARPGGAPPPPQRRDSQVSSRFSEVAEPVSAPPPAPPLPPPPETFAAPPPPPLPSSLSAPPMNPNGAGKPPLPKANSGSADCRGITPQALTAVKLKKVTQQPSQKPSAPTAAKQAANNKGHPNFYIPEPDYTRESQASVAAAESQPTTVASELRQVLNQRRSSSEQRIMEPIIPATSAKKPAASSGQLDFGSDLANAIARRRNQLAKQENGTAAPAQTERTIPEQSETPVRSSMSLKESVRHQMQPAPPPKGVRPPSSSGKSTSSKKDSGYTSSRNSQEPSECGDGPTGAEDFPPPPPEMLNQPTALPPTHGSRVSMISQQLEDQLAPIAPQQTRVPPYPPPKPAADAVSLSSTLSTLSGCSEPVSEQSQSGTRPVRRNAEDLDSGTGDSENEEPIAANGKLRFDAKRVEQWTVSDVGDWLEFLTLNEYRRRFAAARIDGGRLLGLDRAALTSLGVTRVGHKMSIETALKRLKE